MSTPSSRVRHTTPFGRILGAVAAVERHEMPAVIAAFCLFFCVMSGYFSIRPVRDTIGSLMGRERLADIWIVVALVSVLIIPVYGFLVARFRRSVFLPWIYGAISAALVFVGVAFPTENSSPLVGQFFWVFISVLNLFIISVFWSFLLELFRSEQTKRLFGVIAAGGTAGALAGPLFTDLAVETVGNSGILFVGASLFAGAIVCQRVLLTIWKTGVTSSPEAANEPRHERDRALGGNPLAGFLIVARSPYLLAIAAFVFLLAAANTWLFFEQLRLVEAVFPDPESRTRVFARLDWIVQSLTIVSQIFLTGWIASRFGLVVLLTMAPIAMIVGFSALAIWNSFAVLAVVIVVRRFGEYSFVRPGREMLWAPLDAETKYKAKNFVDVPVYRGSDAVIAQLQLAVGNAGFGPQAIALLGVVTAVLWAINGWWLGRRHDAAETRHAARAETLAPSPSPRTVGARP
jgi:AAA family ATP:ADP antiporter